MFTFGFQPAESSLDSASMAHRGWKYSLPMPSLTGRCRGHERIFVLRDRAFLWLLNRLFLLWINMCFNWFVNHCISSALPFHAASGNSLAVCLNGSLTVGLDFLFPLLLVAESKVAEQMRQKAEPLFRDDHCVRLLSYATVANVLTYRNNKPATVCG